MRTWDAAQEELSALKSTLITDIDDDLPVATHVLSEINGLSWAFNALIRAYLANIARDGIPIEGRFMENLLGGTNWEANFDTVIKRGGGAVRIQKTGKGVRASLFLANLIPNQYPFNSSYPGEVSAKKIVEDVVSRYKRIGLDLLSNKVQDVNLNLKTVLMGPSWLDLKDLFTHGALEDEDTDWVNLFKHVSGIRVMINQSPGSMNIVKAGSPSMDAPEFDPEKDIDFRKAYWRIIDDKILSAYVVVDIEAPEVSTMVQTPFKDVKEQYVAQWMAQWFSYYETNNNSWYTRPIGSIVEANRKYVGKDLVKPSKLGIGDMVVSSSADIYYIPIIDNSEKYEHDVAQLGQIEGSTEFSLQPDPTIQTAHRLPANVLIYTDGVNNKLSYTNTVGWETILDLESVTPLNVTQINSILSTQLSSPDEFDAITNHLTVAFRILSTEWFTEQYESADKSMEGTVPVGLNLGNNPMLVSSTVKRILNTYQYVAGGPMADKYPFISEYSTKESFRIYLLSEDSPIPPFRLYGKAIKEVERRIDGDIQGFLKNASVANGLQQIALIKILSWYASKHREIHDQDMERRKLYLTPPDPSWTAKNIPLTKGLVLQQHQNRAVNQVKDFPEFAIQAIPAGGGKTIIALVDILNGLGAGKYKKPLVLCPSHLVKDYVKEANFITGGRLNVIAVTGSTLKSWGEEALTNLISKAPINTIVVSDYDFIKGKSEAVYYGNVEVNLCHNAEFLRQFDFDIVLMDESHYLKNTSIRTESTKKLIGDIKYKRLLSGTFVHDNLTDVVMQFGLFDSSIFGTQKYFTEKYGENIRGGKVISWKPGAQAEVMKSIRTNSAMVRASRKEWAAILPPIEEQFYFEDLTPNQRLVYNSILHETLELIKSENPDLIQKLNSGDESQTDALAAQLNPYLARLEQFMTAPGSDPLGKELLHSKTDIESPKLHRLLSIINEHINNKIPGKILIYTSQIEAARILYEGMPPQIRNKFIYYTAADKFKARQNFEKDNNIIGMIGVEISMNTGNNFQFASRLIRVQSVWSPGQLEQGQQRINRPNLKVKEFRPKIYFDWIVTNRSIDVTKMGRLISKMVSNALFDNEGNKYYDKLEVPPIIPMNLENIMANNDFANTLSGHLHAYQSYKQAEFIDFEAFREDDSINKNPVPVPDGSTPKGSALLRNIPYVPDMDLYGSVDLGLQPYYSYMREHGGEAQDPTGLGVHTQWGDGEVTRSYRNTVRVKLGDGSSQSIDKMSAFIITKKSTSTKSIRDQLIKLAEMPVSKGSQTQLPTSTDDAVAPKVKSLTVSPAKAVQKEGTNKKVSPPKQAIKVLEKRGPIKEMVVEGEAVDLYVTDINGGLALIIDAEDAEARAGELKDYGFKTWSGPYMWAHVKTARQMNALVDGMEAKFDIPTSLQSTLGLVAKSFTQGKSRLFNPIQASQIQLKNFFRLRRQPATSQKQLKPYPLIQDGDLYIVLDLIKQPAARKVKNAVPVPGVKWQVEDGFQAAFFTSLGEMKETLKEMVRDGVVINNLKEVEEDVRNIKPRRMSTKVK